MNMGTALNCKTTLGASLIERLVIPSFKAVFTFQRYVGTNRGDGDNEYFASPDVLSSSTLLVIVCGDLIQHNII